MALPDLPSPAVLRQLLTYEPETGQLFWRFRPRAFFSSDREFKRWNDRYVGQPALTHLTKQGYRRGAIFYRLIMAHRVIFAMVYDHWPKGEIDHINGDRADNRISNLRDCTPEEQRKNQKSYRTNTSGRTGVCWSKTHGKWVARIGDGGRLRNLGFYDTAAEAVTAREAAERELGYHPNHGRSK